MPRVSRRVLAVETLVGIVGEVDCSVLDEVASAPVLVNSCSCAEAWRGNIRQRAVWFSLDDYVPALVGWSKLVPVNVIAVNSKLVKPNICRGDEIRGNG